jgi:CubicO group peptidase (beta-lactamase class C family)
MDLTSKQMRPGASGVAQILLYRWFVQFAAVVPYLVETNRMRYVQKAVNKLGYLSLAFCMVCFVGCNSFLIPKAAPSPITTRSGDAELANLIGTIRVEEGLAALASALIVDGKIHSVAAVGAREYGTDNWITVQDKFLIGSCTKAITASLAAILIDEGVLKWHTTIRDVFPGLEMLPDYENITLAQLLSHRAGLPKNYKNGKTTWLIDYDFDLKHGSTPKYLRLQYLQKTVQNKLMCPPGEMVHYSNSGYILAGAIMEQVTNRSIDDLWNEKIFMPLGISSAGYGPPADSEANMQPLGHYWDEKSNTLVPFRADFPSFFAPAGYMHMTMEDWAKFILMHMNSYPANKTGLIRPGTLRRLHEPPDRAKWDIDIDLGLNYAMGWFTKTDKEGHQLIWHGGRGFDFNAQVIADLNDKSAILIVSTSELPNIHPQTHLLRISQKIKESYKNKFKLPSVI